MKFIPWLIAIVCAALAGYLFGSRPAQTSQTESLEMVVSRTSSAVVSVRTDIADLSDPEMRGSGSAFHIGDGVYVTAAHVVDGGTKIFLDNRNRTVKHNLGLTEAKLIGKVNEFDLAVLRGEKISNKLEWATANPLVGARCLAIGNPFARAPRSVTAGIISGIERLQQTPKGALAGLVQFDAQVNPGNSGGALLDAKGEVLGVVSSILSMTGSSAGVGFAIPTRLVRGAVETLLRGETVQIPVLGISSKDESAVLQTVLPSGLAESAGLLAGDEILEINGLPVETIAEVSAVVAAGKSKDVLPVKAKRGGATRDFTIRIP
jgi:S1-C subfamily serine protease